MIQHANGHAQVPGPAQDDGSFRSRVTLLEMQARQRDADRQYAELRRRVIELIRLTVPRGSTALVVSKGDEELLETPSRRAWHFPRAINGQYAGCYPGSDDEAISHLTTLHNQGAEFLVVPSTSFWWLDYYEGLTTHLQEHHRVASYLENVGVIYQLLGRSAPPK